jgi:hypothetical protein
LLTRTGTRKPVIRPSSSTDNELSLSVFILFSSNL